MTKRSCMWNLYQFPLCPFSRKVRLLLGEKGITYELATEYPWEHRPTFLDINPAGRTPAMRDNVRDITLCDSVAICEYFGITPIEFFNAGALNPRVNRELLDALEQLSEEDLALTLMNVTRLLTK